MQKNIFLHIGTEKTGTTTLQEFLTQNVSQLEAQGFSYLADPAQPYFCNNGHFPVVACLLDGPTDFIQEDKQATLNTVLDTLAKNIAATSHHIILSAEHFSSRLWSVAQLTKLRAVFADYKVHIVVYVRDIVEFALSAYSTSVVCGAKQAFSAQEITADKPYFNFHHMLTLWRGVFGAENMVTRLFDRTQLVQGDIRHDFCALLQINTADFRFQESRNESLDASQLRALQFVNQILPEFKESPEKWRLAGPIRGIIRKRLPKGQALHTLLTREEDQAVRAHFRELHQQVEKEFLFSDALSAGEKKIIASATDEKIGEDSADQELLYNLRAAIVHLAWDFLRLQQQRQPVEKQQKRLVELENQLKMAQAELSALHNSTSWRATVPLRFLGALWRGLFSRRRTRAL